MRVVSVLLAILVAACSSADLSSSPAPSPSPSLPSPTPEPSPTASAATFTIEELRHLGVDLAQAAFTASLLNLGVANQSADEAACDKFSNEIAKSLAPVEEAPDGTLRIHIRSMLTTTKLMAATCANQAWTDFKALYAEWEEEKESAAIRIEELVIDIESSGPPSSP